MEESFSIPPEECGDSELDPRIQLELEKLNTATTEINKLELELDESNTTFRMLLNEATRRLKALSQRLGSSVDKARPYHEAAAAAQTARAACQRAAVAYQRASEIHAAAKETVALAEQRFMSNQHEWQFDNAWQEMLNHATIKVMDAETQKAESGREHQKRALVFNSAETKLQQLDDQLKRHVIKSRPYFEEKQLCQEQLATQKARIETLQSTISKAKWRYSQSLRTLEAISEEIHMKRKDMYGDAVGECPVGPREPGVGAERDNFTDFSLELERHDLGLVSSGSSSIDGCMSDETSGLEELRRRVRRLAARPVEGGAHGDTAWETELNETVNRLDQMLMMRENQAKAKERAMLNQSSPDSRSKSQEFKKDTGALPKLVRNEEASISSSFNVQPEIDDGSMLRNYPLPSSSCSEITSSSEPLQLSVSDLQSLSENQPENQESLTCDSNTTRPSSLIIPSNDPSAAEDTESTKESVRPDYKYEVLDGPKQTTIASHKNTPFVTDQIAHEDCSMAPVICLKQTDEASSSDPKSLVVKPPNVSETDCDNFSILKTVEFEESIVSPEKLSRSMPLQLSIANLSKLQFSEAPQFIVEQEKDVDFTADNLSHVPDYNNFPYQIKFEGAPKVSISNLATSLDADDIGEFPATLKAIESIINRSEKSTDSIISEDSIEKTPSILINSLPENVIPSLPPFANETEVSYDFNEITVVSNEEGQSCQKLKPDPSSVVPLSKDSKTDVVDVSGQKEAPVALRLLNAVSLLEDVDENVDN